MKSLYILRDGGFFSIKSPIKSAPWRRYRNDCSGCSLVILVPKCFVIYLDFDVVSKHCIRNAMSRAFDKRYRITVTTVITITVTTF